MINLIFSSYISSVRMKKFLYQNSQRLSLNGSRKFDRISSAFIDYLSYLVPSQNQPRCILTYPLLIPYAFIHENIGKLPTQSRLIDGRTFFSGRITYRSDNRFIRKNLLTSTEAGCLKLGILFGS